MKINKHKYFNKWAAYFECNVLRRNLGLLNQLARFRNHLSLKG